MRAKDKVIILRATRFGEADLIIQALSQKGYILNFMAKSALKSRKRFGGGILEPTHYLEVGYSVRVSKNDEGAMHFLEEAQLLKDFSGLRSNYDRLELAFHFLRTINKIAPHGDPGEVELFNLLGNALKALVSCEDVLRLRTHFDMKLASQQGILPQELYATDFLEKNLSENKEIETPVKEIQKLQRQINEVLKSYMS